MRAIWLTVVTALLAIPALAAAPTTHTFEQIAPGLYVDHGPVSNSTVFITDEGVLVVDAQTHPKDAEAVITEIRKLTKAPIKWLVNGQFHGDHYLGNAVYKREGATIVAHADTARIIKSNYDYELNRRSRALKDLGYDPAEAVLVEPDVTFTDRMVIPLGGHEVVLMHLGAGQNPGDTIVMFPHLRAAYPSGAFVQDSWSNTSYTPSLDGWIDLLGKIKDLPVDVYLPGHDEIVRDKTEIDDEIAFLRNVKTAVADSIAKGLSAEDTAKALTFEQYKDWRSYETRERNIIAVHYLLTTGRPQYYDLVEKAKQAKP